MRGDGFGQRVTDRSPDAGPDAPRVRLRTLDRPFLLVAGLAIAVIGVLALITTVNGLTPGHAAQPVPVPTPTGPGAPAKPEPTAKHRPEESAKPAPSASARKPAASAERDGALVANGAFTGSIEPWRASPAARFSLEDDQLVVGGSREPAQIASNGFPLRPAQTYTLRFDARSGAPTRIVATVQPQGRAAASILSQATSVGTARQSFVFGFTAPVNTTPSAVLRFEFPADGGRSPATLDNVSVSPA